MFNMDPDQTKVAVLLRVGVGWGGGGESKDQHSTFSEHAQVGNHECSNHCRHTATAIWVSSLIPVLR